MTIRVNLAISTALGLLLAGPGHRQAQAQVSDATSNPYGGYGGYGGFGTYGGYGAWGYGSYWTVSLGSLRPPQPTPQGYWAEVISATSRWIVVQDDKGRQFPIASDSIKQFFVRWPSSISQLTTASMVEATGVDGGSNTVIADHLDIYEADAQNLVTPNVQNLYGNNRTLASIDEDHNGQVDVAYSVSPAEATIPNRVNLVGRPINNNPLQVQTSGNNSMMIVPGGGGMSVSQVTHGTMSYAKRGDQVFIVTRDATTRTLEVTQLVLYKTVPLRAFQP